MLDGEGYVSRAGAGLRQRTAQQATGPSEKRKRYGETKRRLLGHGPVQAMMPK